MCLHARCVICSWWGWGMGARYVTPNLSYRSRGGGRRKYSSWNIMGETVNIVVFCVPVCYHIVLCFFVFFFRFGTRQWIAAHLNPARSRFARVCHRWVSGFFVVVW